MITAESDRKSLEIGKRDMNELQKKTFEMLQIFVGICEKWNIPYYLVCGSALGAVKYGGFIPWDDDIDVGLLRKDYQKFLEVAPKELPEWCFLQNYCTDPAFPHTFSKLRNSGTTFIETGVAALLMNHGIYLDVFPIDGHPVRPLDKLFFEVIQKWNDWIRFIPVDNALPKVRLRNRVLRFLGLHKREYNAKVNLEKLYSAYPPEKSEFWCNYGNWQGELEYAPKSQYGNGAWATFEGLRVRIPEDFDGYLTQKYGDWRSDPPASQQKSHHTGVVIDTERSYQDYL